MTLGIWSCLIKSALLVRMSIILLFLIVSEEGLSTNQSDSATALIPLMQLFHHLSQRRTCVNLYWIGQTVSKQMIFVHRVKFLTIVREDDSVLLVDYSTITPTFV